MHTVIHEYPTMTRRYLASLIDGFIIISSFMLAAYFIPADNEAGRLTRLGIILGAFFIYEPFFTSRLCTLGQKVMRIRIRRVITLERLSFIAALRRSLVKLVLGIVSLFTMHFNEKRRALHDYSAGSVVIYEDAVLETAPENYGPAGNSIGAG